MRYYVKVCVKPGQEAPLREAIEDRTLGAGSIAGGEYLRNMYNARRLEDGTVHWVEVCYCPTPLEEERPYWEEYFELIRVKDAHNRRKCKDWNGEEWWACSNCDCTEHLENKMESWGQSFLDTLAQNNDENN